MTRGATLLFLWAALVVALFPATNAQLMGIDTGSMFFKVALVKPGSPFQIVTNVHSKRKTETLLAFEDGERRFGGDANTLASRRPKQAIAFAPRLLGRSVKHPAIAELANQYLPFQVSEDDTGRGAANLTVVGGGASDAPDVSLSPEEAMAMVLTHAKSNAERFNGGVVTDAVLTVPSYFTVKEREAMRDAAHIAGLRVLSLIEENTAAALQYGISRIFNETHTMLVFNMGASSTQVSVFEYTSYTLKKGSKNQTFGQFKTIGKGWDESLGGFAFDLKLVEFMADAFDASKQRKGKKPVRKNDRSMAKLRKTAGKVKQVLSANKKYPITIESLCDDMDFRGTLITRDEFEEMSSDLFDRVLGPVERALEMANKTAEDIDQIEIVGGGVRIPKVQALLVEMFKLKSASDLGVHLNGDEAMALGAAFRAANMSKAFRVGRVERSVGMVETANYPIGLRLEEIAAEEAEEKEEDSKDDEAPPKDGESDAETKKKKKKWSKRVSLFSRKSDLLKKKKIKLTHDHDFQVILKYDSHSKAPLDDSTSKVFHEFNVTGLRKFATGEYKHLGTPAVELVFQINDDGIPVVTKAEAKLEEIITPEVKDEEKAEEPSKDGDGAESEEKAGSEESSKAEEKTDESSADKAEEKSTDDATAKEGEADEDAGKDDKAETSDGDKKEQDENGSDKTADDKSKEETKQKKAPKPRKRVHRVQLKLVPTVSEAQTLRRLSQKERNTAIKRLKEMDAADELRQRRDAEKNSLESFVFEQRGRVRENEEELSKVSPDEEREKIMEDLEALEDWLYEDGEDGGADAELSVYKSKRKSMQVRIDSIFLRLVELEARPKAVEAARAVIASAKEVMLLWPKERPQLSAEDIKEVEEVMEEVSKWIDEKEEEQSKKETTDTPAFTSKEVSNKMTRLKNLVARLLMKKRPAPASAEDLLKSEKTGDDKEEEKQDGDDKEDSATGDEEGTSSGEEEKTAEDETEKAGSEEL